MGGRSFDVFFFDVFYLVDHLIWQKSDLKDFDNRGPRLFWRDKPGVYKTVFFVKEEVKALVVSTVNHMQYQ